MAIEDLREIGNVLYERRSDGMLYPVRRVRPDTEARGVPAQDPSLLNVGGIGERLAFLNQTFNPVEGIGSAMRAGSRMMAPDQSYWERIAALGEMASGVASIAAPIAAARSIGVPAASAMMEGLLGGSPTTQAAGDMARRFGMDESGALPGAGRGQDLPTPRNEAEAMARDILQLRAEGRADEVTDEMMAAADPQYMYSNTPLPMDYASRMARAEEMGLSPDEAYHGTPYADIQALRPSGFGAVGPGVYVSRSTDTAGDYARGYGLMRPDVFEQDFVRYTEGGNVTPVRVPSNLQPFNEWSDARMKDMQRQGLYGIGPRADEAASAQAQDLGFEGVAARNENAVIFDPSRIRSRFARFDPAFASLRNLSAGVGGAAVLTALGDDAEAGTPETQIIGLVNQAGIAGAAEALGVSRRDIEEAMSIALPPSQWDQLVVGPQ
jgi:hypothetical protein